MWDSYTLHHAWPCVLSCSSLQDTKTLAHKIYTPLKYYTADFNILPCFGKCTIFTQTPRLSINAISLGLALGNVRHYFTVNATFQHSKESKRKQTSSSSQLHGHTEIQWSEKSPPCTGPSPRCTQTCLGLGLRLGLGLGLGLGLYMHTNQDGGCKVVVRPCCYTG